ncbi:PEP-CTERM sorting domain-containing protein [Duganella sp.]|uniref:PEP-CTERM sorting domain-containing protein n=1 Tax=Duganella sp. TaxID=1904440 RepID=UPI0031D081CF
MKKFTFATLLAASLSIAMTGHASAANSAASSLGNFHITLIDLDLTDGVTPSFQLMGASAPTARVLTLDQDSTLTAAGPFESIANSNAGTYFSQWASASGAGTLETLWLQAAAQSNGANTGRFDAAGRATAGLLNFELSAHTGIRISADTSVSAASSGLIPGAEFTSTVGIATMDAYIGHEGSWEYAWTALSASTLDLRGESDALLPKHDAASGTLTLVYDNTTAASKSGVLDFRVGADISQFPAAPVPEPASYAMFGAGLALLGAARARRRQR